MSKAQASKAQENAEEWEDVDEDEDEEEEEEDTTIANSDVVMRYKKAAQWANEVVIAVAALAVPGASVKAICVAGDDLIATKVQQLFRGVDKGAAFPTCVSVNSIVCHFNGTENDDVIIALNDVVRIDLGIHVDGYPVMVAHTIQVTANGELNPESKEAQVIAAGYATIDAALRQVRPGNNTTAVADVIEKCAAHFGLASVEGVLSHQLKRYIVDGWKAIPARATTEHKLHEYEIEPNTVWALDVLLTTSKGLRLKERDAKPCLYKATIDGAYEPKLEAAFAVRAEVSTKYQFFPFPVARLEAPKAKLGLSELAKHSSIVPLPVLYEKDGEIVAHFKVTLLVTDKKIERVTGVPLQKGAPTLPAYTDEDLAAKAKLSLALVKKEKKEKK